MDTNLDKEFQKAFDLLSKLEENLAPDIMLKLYAYYKQGVSGDVYTYQGDPDVRDAFKFNAWMQLNGMSQEDAKREYVSLAKKILTTNFNQES
ncbi:acyl-CoA-binding protein [Pseudotenacibaculum haliotis]|uniref:Acyl-CoA-binding protein n=1 Tax=Pseudotenacibaculum haliotis TaxID=1862138 RepID=A0ABW5LNF8_9FLAO